MKYFSYILLFILISCQNKKEEINKNINLYLLEKVHFLSYDDDSEIVLQFRFDRTDTSSNIKEEVYFENGKIVRCIKYYKNGNMKMDIPISKTSYHGIVIHYNEYGSKIKEVSMRYGKIHGKSYTFHNLGDKKYSEIVYYNGKYISKKILSKKTTYHSLDSIKYFFKTSNLLEIQNMQQYLFNQTLIKDTTDSFVKKSTKYLEFLNNFSNNMIDHCGGIKAPYGEIAFPYNRDCIINYFDDNNLKEFNQKYQNYIYACRKVKVPIIGMAMEQYVTKEKLRTYLTFDEIESKNINISHVDYAKIHFNNLPIKDVQSKLFILRNTVILALKHHLLKKKFFNKTICFNSDSISPFYLLEIQNMQQHAFNQTLIKDSTDEFLKTTNKYLSFLENFNNEMETHCENNLAPYIHTKAPNNKSCVNSFLTNKKHEEFNKKYQNYIYACRKVKVPITGMAMERYIARKITFGLSTLEEIQDKNINISDIDYTKIHFNNTSIKDAQFQILTLKNTVILALQHYLLHKEKQVSKKSIDK